MTMTTITVTNPNAPVAFNTLAVGDWFIYQNVLFIRVSAEATGQNVFDVAGKVLSEMAPNNIVLPCAAVTIGVE